MTAQAEQVNETYRCPKCGTEKISECFGIDRSRKSGKQCWCKACVKNRYAKNREEYLKKRAEYYANHRDAILKHAVQYRVLNFEKIKAKERKYADRDVPKLREIGRQRYAKIKSDPIKYSALIKRNNVNTRIYEKRFPHKHGARVAVQKAIKAKQLLRPTSCSKCQNQCKPEAHHDSYEREHWLDVRWLCRKCHMEHHRKYPDQPV